MHPAGAVLQGDDPLGAATEQLAVVGDQQDGLGGLQEALLQPALGRHVQEVVGLVQQQHRLLPAQQLLQHQPLLLAPGKGAGGAVLHLLEGLSQGGQAALVPERLGPVATHVIPVRQRLCEGHLGLLAGVLVHLNLGGPQQLGGGPHRGGRGRGHQSPDRKGPAHAADGLVHYRQLAADADRALVGDQLPGDQAEEGRLAATVGADQGSPRSLSHAEGNIADEVPPAFEPVAHVGQVDVCHGFGAPSVMVCRVGETHPRGGRARGGMAGAEGDGAPDRRPSPGPSLATGFKRRGGAAGGRAPLSQTRTPEFTGAVPTTRVTCCLHVRSATAVSCTGEAARRCGRAS